MRGANGWGLLALAGLLLAGACRRPPGAFAVQTLYDRTPAFIRAVEVDDRNVYWSEYGGPDGSQVMMAPKAGGGTPVRLGAWTTFDRSLNLIVADQTHVYWLEQTRLHRVRKDDPGDALEIELGAGHGGALAEDDQSLYVADLNCTAIGRVSKVDLAVAFTPIAEASPLGGVTGIAVDGSDVYCGRGPNIFAQPRGGGETTKIVGDQEQIGPVASDGTNVYWGNNRSVSGTRTENIGMIPRSGGSSATDLGPSGGIGQLGVIRLDRMRQRLYWMTCPNDSVPITTMDLASKHFDDLIEGQSSEGCGFADDETHLYWAARNGVMRMPK